MSSSSVNSSSSNPEVVTTPENGILDQIAQYASSLAPQMYNWAQGVFSQTSAITDQAVGNFFQVSQNMLGLSGNLTDQYNNLFAPENAQLVADANSYASPARMEADMGMAGATAAQAGSAALANSEEALRSYGIDPSSGRYAALDKAADVQNAANVAGAENQQRVADITTGQNLRSQAVQVGATLPAAISNVNNTAIQANTGASNAELANANTGANLMNLPNNYLQTAMGLKLSPVGQRSSSSGSSSSQPKDSSSNSGSGNGSNGNGSGSNPGSGSSWFNPNNYTQNSSAGGGGGLKPGAGNTTIPGQLPPETPGTPTDPNDPGLSGPDYGSGTGASDNPTGAGEFGSTFGSEFGGGDPFGEGNQFGGISDSGFGSTGDTGLGDTSYDPSSNPAQLPEGWNDPSSQTQDPAGGWPDTGGDNSGGGSDNSGGDNSGGDNSGGGSDTSGGGDSGSMDWSDFATGGLVMATGGRPRPMLAEHEGHTGPIPASMSPSGGRKVDDIPASGPGGAKLHVNAHEFIIPDDVARWKGEEFFQNLIAQSRKRRMTGSVAKPTAGPPR